MDYEGGGGCWRGEIFNLQVPLFDIIRASRRSARYASVGSDRNDPEKENRMAIIQSKPIPELTEADIRRFWKKVNKAPGQGPTGECWLWTASRSKLGYGKLMIARPSQKRPYLASRISYKLFTGEDPAPFCVLHVCDVPACVRPEHLYKGTLLDNARDMMERNRQGGQFISQNVRGEKSVNAKLTEDQIREIRRMYASEAANQYQLAALYGVTRPAIGYIVRRINWPHVT